MAARSTQRKERLRRATMEEIRATARRLLVERGAASVTVNAVAREMGLSGPALYHYYAGHEELVEALVVELYRELTDAMTSARDAHPQVASTGRLLALCRAMRSWAVAHPAEFTWVFTKLVPRVGDPPEDSLRHRAGVEFERVFLDQFVELWHSAPFPVPRLDELDPSLTEQLRAFTTSREEALPPEAAHVFLTCWIRLYGLVCMESLHQLDFAFTDMEPVFEQALREMVRDLGLEYAPPER